MTPEVQNALAYLEAVAASANQPLDAHIQCKRAVEVLKKALGAPESPEVGAGVPEQGKA